MYHMKQIDHMQKNLKYFLITSCADIQLSCADFLHQQGAFKKCVHRGGGRSIKSELKPTEGGQAYLYVRFLKKMPDFSNSKQSSF